jgi:hypothetical protein
MSKEVKMERSENTVEVTEILMKSFQTLTGTLIFGGLEF